MVPVMSDTKWDDVRNAMLSIDPRPMRRSRDCHNGFVSEWDGEWCYHFRIGGYDTIEWVEIRLLAETLGRRVRVPNRRCSTKTKQSRAVETTRDCSCVYPS